MAEITVLAEEPKLFRLEPEQYPVDHCKVGIIVVPNQIPSKARATKNALPPGRGPWWPRPPATTTTTAAAARRRRASRAAPA